MRMARYPPALALRERLWASSVTQLTDRPHDKVRDALKNLYHSCSDYPGIRHGGNPTSAKRALCSRDLTMASLLILSFSGYLSQNFDERTVLGL